MTTGYGYSKGRINTFVKRKIAYVRIYLFSHTKTIFYSRAMRVRTSRKTSKVKREKIGNAQSEARNIWQFS